MCDPASLAIVAIGSTVASTAMGFMGAMQQAQAQSAAASYQAAVARNNKIVADRAAEDALARGRSAEVAKANETNRLMGRQTISLAANGMDVGSGSSLDLIGDTAAQGQLDQLTVRSNAYREAAGYAQQGAGYASQAAMADATASGAESAGLTRGFTTLIAGAGQVAGQWYDMKAGTRRDQVNGSRSIV